MGRVRCPYCGGGTKRFGKTKAGSQRWRCRGCGATFTRRIDNAAKRLSSFLSWLTSGERQSDMPGGGRTFRRRCAEFWAVWPLPPATGEAHRVVFVDGIRIARDVVVLIANLCGAFVLGLFLEYLLLSGEDVGGRRAARLFFGTGACGSFTTYGTMVSEGLGIAGAGSIPLAAFYLGLALCAGAALAALGMRCAKILAARKGGAR